MNTQQFPDMTLPSLISRTFQICQKHYLKFMGIVALGIVAHVVLTVILSITQTEPAVIPVLIATLIYLWSWVALVWSIDEVIQGHDFSIRQAFHEAQKVFGMFFLTSMLVTLIIMAGGFLLIAPGVYFWVVLSLAGIIVILEQGGVIESLKRSTQLIKGYWLIAFVLQLFILIVPLIIAFSIEGIVILTEAPIIRVVRQLISILTVPFFTAISVVFYDNLVTIKDDFEQAYLKGDDNHEQA